MDNQGQYLLCEDFVAASKNRERVAKKQNIKGYPSVYDVPEVCPYLRTVGGYSKEVDEDFYDYRCELSESYCTKEYGGKCDALLEEEENFAQRLAYQVRKKKREAQGLDKKQKRV